MANRLVSNVYIIDSQLNAVQLPWGDASNIPKIRIQSIGIFSVNSNAQVSLALKNTANVVYQFGFQSWGGAVGPNVWSQFQTDFLGGVEWQDVYVPLCVNATAYLYLI